MLVRLGVRKREHSTGVSVSDTRAETAMAAVTVDGEFAEQPADDAAHQQQRNEHRDQRDADRHDGEADLARALQRRLDRGPGPARYGGTMFSTTTMAIVDHEADARWSAPSATGCRG